MADGLVYFGSSADDTVRALDAASGQLKWRFTAAGPIRFAPHIAGGKCYVASDDGFLYCLHAATGRLAWQFRAAPDDRRLLGNGRMISRWPCRSGVLVDDGVAYVAAGMWPSEGIHVYALDAETGRELWRNDTSGCMSTYYPHGGAYALGGVAPQGYLLASEDILLVPTGRSVPAGYDRRTGRLRYYLPGPNKLDGGCWATIGGEVFFNPAHGGSPDVSISPGESGPRPGDGMKAHSLASGLPRGFLPNRHRVLAHGDILYAVGNGKVEAIDLKAPRAKRAFGGPVRWTSSHPRAYCLAFAGRTLLVGGVGSITAFDGASGKEAWRAEVKGQVRGLAVANGRVVAATNRGTIYAFEHRKERTEPPGPPRRPARKADRDEKPGLADKVADLIRRSKITKGYALVLGQPDARLAEALAKRTELHVINVLANRAKVADERARLLDTTRLYGSRVVVQHLDGLARLPYASYFANAVVVSGKAERMSGEELYRVLRPCGGILCFGGIARPEAERLIHEGKVPPEEVRPWGKSLMVVRGKLPGAFDWDSKVTCDHRLKWPLELLWFGGPGPDRMVARHWGAPTPVPANGLYFAIGEHHVIAVDAYNGTELWSREIPGLFAHRFLVSAADDSVYVTLGRKRPICIQLDARTGDLVRTYGRFKPSQRFSLATPQTFKLDVDEHCSGTITLRNTPAALELTLLTRDPDVTRRDAWEVFFDFRPASERFGAYGRGAFQGIVAARAATWRPGAGPAHPKVRVTSKPSRDGTHVVVQLPWDEVAQLTGHKPRAFAFAAALNACGQDQAVVRVHKFAGADAAALNNGWATFLLDPAQALAETPKIVTGALGDLPEHARRPGRLPRRGKADAAFKERTHPLTAKSSQIAYRRTHGCSGEISSATMQFFRSATVGIYDLEDDSGLRNFSGVRPGCGVTLLPALGLLISSEGSATCSCSYNFQTSLALAPASARRNEDWAVFFDSPAHGITRQAALNFGAPGDRRDDRGLLWLGCPRPYMRKRYQAPDMSLPVKCALEIDRKFGAYRFNADRLTIAGTDRPWIYASGMRGLRRAVLKVECLRPIVAVASQQPPKIDGRLDEACWDGSFPLGAADRRASVFLRHDADNLYIGYRRPAVIDRRGRAVPWRMETKGEDAPAWRDDSFEVYVSDTRRYKCVHLGASASGARYDAFWTYVPTFPVFDIPRIEGIAIDGKTDDWGDKGFRVGPFVSRDGTLRSPEDFDPSFRLGWDERGVLLMVRVRDQSIAEAETRRELWRGDSIEVFMATSWRARPAFRLAMGTGADRRYPDLRTYIWDYRRGAVAGKLTAEAAGGKTEEGYLVEALLPWKNLDITPAAGREIGLQILVNDSDPPGRRPGERFQAAWRPLDRRGRGGRMSHRVRLAAEASAAVRFERGKEVTKGGLIRAQRPFPFPLKDTSLGRRGEEAAWQGTWASAVQAAEKAFTVEMAIPWKTLAKARLEKGRLLINMASHGKLSERPGKRFLALELLAGPQTRPRPHTVRLHFAELEDVKVGERVFDLKLQGQTVLESFDIIKEAGGARRAVVKEFRGIQASDELILELVPKARELTATSAPILSGMEVVAEQ